MKSLSSAIYPAIFTRKSTRSYDDTPISQDKIDSVKRFIETAVPLFPSERAAFEILPHKGNTMKIAAYAGHEAASLMNLAFMLQQMDLFLQTNGIGTLWNATVSAAKKQYLELPYVICLVFGMAKENPVRTDAGQFIRKQPGEISNRPELHFIEAVRLAPSSRNRQLWYLACGESYIDFYCKQGGLLDKTLLKNLNWLDMGIALCHAALALLQEGYTPSAFTKTDAHPKAGYVYCVSLNY